MFTLCTRLCSNTPSNICPGSHPRHPLTNNRTKRERGVGTGDSQYPMTLYPSLHAISRSSSSPATSGRPQLHLTDCVQGPLNPTTSRGCWDDRRWHFQIALRWVDRRRRFLIALRISASHLTPPFWLLVMPERAEEVIIGLPHFVRHLPDCFVSHVVAAVKDAHTRHADDNQPSNFLTLCEKLWISIHTTTEFNDYCGSRVQLTAHHHRSPISKTRLQPQQRRNNATTNRPHFHWRPLARPRSLQAPDSLRLSQVQHVAPLRDRPAVSRPHRAHYPDFLHSTRPYNSGSPGRIVLLLSHDGSTSHPTCPLMLDPTIAWTAESKPAPRPYQPPGRTLRSISFHYFHPTYDREVSVHSLSTVSICLLSWLTTVSCR